jgi:multidrug efflux pump subunit AcrA (membrane-fusion protein)
MRTAQTLLIVLIAALLSMGLEPLGPGISRAAEEKILASGTLEAADYAALRNEVGRPLPLLYMAEPGKMVKKGNLLAELDAGPLVKAMEEQELQMTKTTAERAVAEASLRSVKQEADATIDLARMALEVARGDLKTYVDAEFPMQVAELRNEIRVAEAKLRLVEIHLTQLRGPDPDRAEDEARIAEREAEFARTQAQAQIEVAQNKLGLLENILSSQRKAQLQLVVAQRELELTRAQNQFRTGISKSEAALRIAQAAGQMQSNRLERLKQEIRASKIVAPRDGMVISPQAARPRGSAEPTFRAGDVVPDRQIILHVADTSRLQLDVETTVEVAQRITTGRPATIRFDALPDRAFRGHVARMRILPEGPGGPAIAEIKVRLDEPSKDLLLGMTAKIEFDPT